VADAVIIPGTDRALRKLFAGVTNAFEETLRSIIDRELNARVADLGYLEVDEFLDRLESPMAVIRGGLDKDFAGKTLYIAMPMAEAITIAGLMMMTPDETLATKRKSGQLDGEDLEAFGEVGNMLCSAADGVLRDSVSKPIGARLQDTGQIRPGVDAQGVLGSDPLLFCRFRLKVGDHPEVTGYVLIDRDTATEWNDGVPLLGEPRDGHEGGEASDDHDDAEGGSGDGARAAEAAARQRLLPGEDAFDDIPEAEIRGRLAAYLHQPEVYDVIRRAARRVGLEIERHSRAEIPNPAAHRDQIIVLDVPPGEDRRFDWCRRLKGYSGKSLCVLLVIQHPSKSRVLQGFMAKADAIVGWPLRERDLSQKLTALMERLDMPPTSDPDGGDAGGQTPSGSEDGPS